MSAIFSPVKKLFKKVVRELGDVVTGSAGAPAPAAAKPAAAKPAADRPAAGTETTAAITEARQRAGRRRARRTGGMRLLMSQGNADTDGARTKLGPGQ